FVQRAHAAASPVSLHDALPSLHAMLAAWKLVPSTRGRIADPGLWPVDVTPFTSKDTAAARWRCFDPNRALDRETLDALERGGCRSEEHTSELQSRENLVCRLLL